MKKDYIPELSEIRMVRRAPEGPFALAGEDAAYIEACLRDVEAAFGFDAFPGVSFARISGRALIEAFIDWWRALEPDGTRQQEAHARLPAAIRLLDTVSSLMEERAPVARNPTACVVSKGGGDTLRSEARIVLGGFVAMPPTIMAALLTGPPLGKEQDSC